VQGRNGALNREKKKGIAVPSERHGATHGASEITSTL